MEEMDAARGEEEIEFLFRTHTTWAKESNIRRGPKCREICKFFHWISSLPIRELKSESAVWLSWELVADRITQLWDFSYSTKSKDLSTYLNQPLAWLFLNIKTLSHADGCDDDAHENSHRKIKKLFSNFKFLIILHSHSAISRCKWFAKTRPPNLHTIPNTRARERVSHKSLSHPTTSDRNGSCTLPHRATN